MKSPVMHLNLLNPGERRSSSPVRLRVMLPLLSGLALAVTLGWWAVLETRLLLVEREVKAWKKELSANAKAHAEYCVTRDRMRALEAESRQEKGYLNACLGWGDLLAALPAACPDGMQLTTLEIPLPPPQRLSPPPGVKAPPLLGPTGVLERVTLRLAGRTVAEERLLSLLQNLSAAAFTNVLVQAKDAKGASASPRMRQFRQDANADLDGNRAIVFDVEYGTVGRRFDR